MTVKHKYHFIFIMKVKLKKKTNTTSFILRNLWDQVKLLFQFFWRRREIWWWWSTISTNLGFPYSKKCGNLRESTCIIKERKILFTMLWYNWHWPSECHRQIVDLRGSDWDRSGLGWSFVKANDYGDVGDEDVDDDDDNDENDDDDDEALIWIGVDFCHSSRPILGGSVGKSESKYRPSLLCDFCY